MNAIYLTIIVFLILIAFLYILNVSMVVEMFMATRSRCPTRNMSYDLRGDAYFPARVEVNFMNSSIGPFMPLAC